MSMHTLLSELRRRNIRLWSQDGELRFAAPRNALTEQLRDTIVSNRSELLRIIEAGRDEQVPESAHDDAHLSFAQQRLLFLQQLEGPSPAYNVPLAVRVRGPLDLDTVRAALDALQQRHDSLRTCFREVDGQFERVMVNDAPIPLHTIILPPCLEKDREMAISRIVNEEARRTFDMSVAPLARVTCIVVGPQDSVLLITLHHVIADGWSLDVLQKQFWSIYTSIGTGCPLTTVSGSYVSYVRWQQGWLRSADYRTQKKFWMSALNGAPEVIELPTDQPRPSTQDHAGAVSYFDAADPAIVAGLTQLCRATGASLYMGTLAAFYILLWRYTGQRDLSVGSPVANRRERSWENVIGFFANVAVLRARLNPRQTFREFLGHVRDQALAAYDHQEFPFEQVVEFLQPRRSLSHSPLFQVMFMLKEEATIEPPPGLSLAPVEQQLGIAKFDLTLTLRRAGEGLSGGLEYATSLFEPETAKQIAEHYVRVLQAVAANPDVTLDELSLEDTPIATLDSNVMHDVRLSSCVHEWIAAQAVRAPDAVALTFRDQHLTYGQLDSGARALAAVLQAHGAAADRCIGIYIDRSVDLVVAMLGVMYSGAAYVPLDPTYPEHRVRHAMEDSRAIAIVSTMSASRRLPASDRPTILLDEIAESKSEARAFAHAASENLAYTIYTSGSTGTPKGVMVTHRNLANLFIGLDRAVGANDSADPQATVWLALTSVSFDISVLELLWTLSRGYRVVIETDHRQVVAARTRRASGNSVEKVARGASRACDFGLFYFAADASAAQFKYELLIEGAKFADSHGLCSLWVPERHFHPFGGHFPNPSVAASAVAMLTKRIEIRAGSVVLPLHDPLRVAEEWAMVDNLSQGRVALAFASGWHFNDFVLSPGNYAERHKVMKDGIETVQRLWRGETTQRTDGLGNSVQVRVYPAPLQPQLPVWITSAASPDTFRYAGEIGANVLTHLLGQSLQELAEKIAIYRQARAAHGRDPATGRVALMLHTFVGEDLERVRETVREPFKNYLRSSINLLKPVAASQGLDAGKDLELVVEAGFQRYFATSALFGTPASCLELVRSVHDLGVDEIACLIDFGVAPEQVREHFRYLAQLRELVQRDRDDRLADAAAHRDVTHLQCTPSFARMLLEQPESKALLSQLTTLLVGGEALTPALARDLHEATPAALFNMYGPTETTVWSAVHEVRADEAVIGAPIFNTQLHVLDDCLNRTPTGARGELYIGGEGVARGYWNRPELTAERFIPDPYATQPGRRLYRTGDAVRRRRDGTLQFLGRLDTQVKVRGFRVELGEIESTLLAITGIKQAVAVVRGKDAEAAIAAYVVSAEGGAIDRPAVLEQLRTVLPEYMVPSVLLELPAMPMTPNGKVDRNALPDPSAVARSLVQQDVPKTEYEQRLAGIWCELLKLPAVGVQENFFELGGHSLLLGRMQVRIEQAFDHKVSIIDLFRYPTIASLARVIGAPVVVPVEMDKAQARARARQRAVSKVRETQQQRKRNGHIS